MCFGWIRYRWGRVSGRWQMGGKVTGAIRSLINARGLHPRDAELVFRPLFLPFRPFSLIHAFSTFTIHLIPSKPLMLSICTNLILGSYFSFHFIVSLLYIRIGTFKASCWTLTHSGFKDLIPLIPPSTFLPFTTFLRHFASYVPDVYKTQSKYLNYDTGSNRTSSR